MTERVCMSDDCDRLLQEEDGDYCPHCKAKRAGIITKAVGVATTAVGLGVIVAGAAAKLLGNRK